MSRGDDRKSPTCTPMTAAPPRQLRLHPPLWHERPIWGPARPVARAALSLAKSSAAFQRARIASRRARAGRATRPSCHAPVPHPGYFASTTVIGKKKPLPNGEKKKPSTAMSTHPAALHRPRHSRTDKMRDTYTEAQRKQRNPVQRCTASDTQRASAGQEKEKRREHEQDETQQALVTQAPSSESLPSELLDSDEERPP